MKKKKIVNYNQNQFYNHVQNKIPISIPIPKREPMAWKN